MIKSKHNVIIIHGYNGEPDTNWFPWLRSELKELGVESFTSQMPKEHTLENWLEAFDEHKDSISENTILIGHSLGVATILHALARLEQSVFSTILVAGFGKSLDIEADWVPEVNAFTQDIPWKKARKNAGTIKIISSTNDEYISKDISIHLSTMLKSPVEFVEDGGHFRARDGYEKFPKLLDYIKSQIYLTYDEFKKLDARVGHIMKVEPVEDSDKLLRFEIDFGEGEPRQIVSGIREFFPDYESLVGKQALYVLNLEPREIRGITSFGMLMAVDGVDGNPVFLIPETPVQPGSNVR